MFTTYEEVVTFINQQKDRVYSLDNFKRYMASIDNPQLQLPCIHVGGTNGKGSTTNYIKEVLKEAGYQVGTFTSPALYSRLDIIRINDVFIDEEVIVGYANRYVNEWLEYELSMFEMEVCIAILYFIETKVDLAIFEVGLGGTLDATNIIHPIVAVNTNIGLDHVDYLGNTYEEIARNKAGIIKDGVDYITGETKIECLNVFKEICQEHHSQLHTLDTITNIKDGNMVEYQYRDYHIILSTPALYQIQNSALALEVLLYIQQKGLYTFTKEQVLVGMKNAIWHGRFEIVNEDPLMIVDGAHNKEGVEAFAAGAKKYPHSKIIFSALRDKDTHAMIECLLTLSDDVTICQFDHKRAASLEELINGFPVKSEPDYKKAIDEAFTYPGVVFITGSLYFVAMARAYIKMKKGESTL